MDSAVLKGLSIFQDLTAEELALVAKAAFERTYRDQATLFLENMPGEVMYIVKSGSVDLSKRTPSGEDKVFVTLPAGEFFGEMSLIDESPRSASATVRDGGELIVLSKKSLRELMANHPAVAAKLLYNILCVVNTRLRRMTELIKHI
jgi:CRP/FNR family transcriptional regulator, cyclic AMP receptor protein